MKWLRLLILFAYIVPLVGVSNDACCGASDSHESNIQMSGDHSLPQLTAVEDCCGSTSCAECTLCHLQSFSPTPHNTAHRRVMSDRDTISFVAQFREIVSTVLTPPPTL